MQMVQRAMQDLTYSSLCFPEAIKARGMDSAEESPHGAGGEPFLGGRWPLSLQAHAWLNPIPQGQGFWLSPIPWQVASPSSLRLPFHRMLTLQQM